MKDTHKAIIKALVYSGKIVLCCASIMITVLIFGSFLFSGSAKGVSSAGSPAEFEVIDRYDKYVNNTFSDALDGVLSIKKVYWLSDEDVIAPEPDQDKFGETKDPMQVQAVIDQASELLDGQRVLFDPDTEFFQNDTIRYYYDETLLVITWKIVADGSVYTLSEVKIADPSQFRRFLSDGEYSSGAKYFPSELATTVNAVVAANGDYYAMRQMGTIVYNSQIMRTEGTSMDCCYIDKNGDLRFFKAGEMTDPAETQKFVTEEGVRFSLAFGPILVENGELTKAKSHYPVGEAGGPNARAAICQMGELHYLLVYSSPEPPYAKGITLDKFANTIHSFGVDKAYNLDGGRSGALIMNDKLINYVYEREISDIIYFATAISNGD